MTEIQRRFDRALRIVTVLGTIGAGSLCRGQGDGAEAEEDAPAQPAFQANDRMFERWVFMDRNTGMHHQLETFLRSRIQEIDHVCHLTESQREELRLAGRGDIKRYLDRIEEKRKEFELVKNDQVKYLKFSKKIQPFRVELMSEPFGEGSIFAKTLGKTLDEGQTIRCGNAQRTKKEAALRDLVDRFVTMENQTLRLSLERRRRFTDMLLKEIKLPRRSGPYDTYVVLFQLSRLPEAKIRPILDDAQWGMLSRQFRQVKTMVPTLLEIGLLPDTVASQDMTDR